MSTLSLVPGTVSLPLWAFVALVCGAIVAGFAGGFWVALPALVVLLVVSIVHYRGARKG